MPEEPGHNTLIPTVLRPLQEPADLQAALESSGGVRGLPENGLGMPDQGRTITLSIDASGRVADQQPNHGVVGQGGHQHRGGCFGVGDLHRPGVDRGPKSSGEVLIGVGGDGRPQLLGEFGKRGFPEDNPQQEGTVRLVSREGEVGQDRRS